MALKSSFFTWDRETRTRLQRCQLHDSDNIKLGAKGKHVSAVQEALRRLVPGLLLPTRELADPIQARHGIYGPETAAAVARYKRNHAPPILNHRNAIDDVVGKKTITALDEGMYQLENRGRSDRGKFRPFLI